jgi:hypothetical protein
VDVLARAAPGGDASAAEFQVEFFDVEAEDLFGAGGGLVQGPVLPNVSLAANWAVVPGQRCARDGSWERVWGESVTTGVRVSARCCVRATIVIVGFHDPPVGHRLPPVM